MKATRVIAAVFTLAACLSATGWGGGSAEAAGPTRPGAPRSVYAVPYGTVATGGARLTWKAPTSNGGAPITGYVVTTYRAGVAQPPITFPGTQTTRVVTPLRNGKSYRFGVAALNAAGKGAMSPLSAGIVAGAPGQPGKPTIGKGGNPDRPGVPLLPPGQIYLRSARPWSNGDRNLHFDARCTSSNGGQARNQPIDFSQSPLAHVTGLTPNKTYRCTAAASNKYGTGPRSTPSNALVV